MKAQVSIEYMALLLVFMTVLSLSVAVLFSIKDTSEKSAEIISFKAQINELDNKIRTVCFLGSGNKRSLELKYPIELDYLDEQIEYNYKNYSILRHYPCSVTGDYSLEDLILIENLDGIIYLEK